MMIRKRADLTTESRRARRNPFKYFLRVSVSPWWILIFYDFIMDRRNNYGTVFQVERKHDPCRPPARRENKKKEGRQAPFLFMQSL